MYLSKMNQKFKRNLQNGVGDLKRYSAGTPKLSKVTTATPYGFNSSRNAHDVPSTEFRDAL